MVPHEIKVTLEHDPKHRLHTAHIQHPGQGSDGPPAILPGRPLINPQEMMLYAVCSFLLSHSFIIIDILTDNGRLRARQIIPNVRIWRRSNSVQEDGYYHEYCRLYLANIALTNQVKDLID